MTTETIKPVSFKRFGGDFDGFSGDLGGSFARYGFAVISDHSIVYAPSGGHANSLDVSTVTGYVKSRVHGEGTAPVYVSHAKPLATTSPRMRNP